MLSWLAKSPEGFAYETELWTTRRLAEVIERRFGVRFNSNYLAAWLTRRDYSPQKPEVKAVERDNPSIAAIDESGFSLNPTVRRTRAPKGSTPVLTGFGRHRDKVSAIAAIGVAPAGAADVSNLIVL